MERIYKTAVPVYFCHASLKAFLGQQPKTSTEDGDTARFISWLPVFFSVSVCDNAS